MVKPEMIPRAAREAAIEHVRYSSATLDQAIPDAIAAALSAWPGMETEAWVDRHGNSGRDLILPLPETQNDRD